MLVAYRQHVAERAELGIPALPLTAQQTTELVALAHDHGLSIEAEVGSIGGEEDGVIGSIGRTLV